ncbi:hypothetical protein Ahy_A02g007059 [Arachis hypogaea]|uniref:2-(3-amino-3-carboxypropyl)histidine synthase subunit 1 n=1 Tax=Arachis hypogaea TaxID=3818 RepID=A0A445EBI1_ARAHY|nr:hypothetical protein Ahy_A02g007059 [Arachis hypogaea]
MGRSGGRWKGKIAGDVTCGACYVDDFSAAALSTDLLIHYGHSCLVPIDSTTIPCLYVFVNIKIDVFHLVDTVKLNIKSCTQNLVLAGIIQIAYAIRAAKPELEKSMLRVLVSQSKPLSAGEVLRCTAPKVSLMHSCSENPENSVLVFVAVEEYHHVGMKKSRKGAILRAREEARNWGVILETLGRQGNSKILERLEKNMKEKWFLYTIFSMSEISRARIALFEDFVDAWIQIACLRLSIDWGDAFGKPVLSPVRDRDRVGGDTCCGEDENGNKKSDFGGEYPMDYSQDGGEWNSSYVKKSSRSGVYVHGDEGSEDLGEREGVHEEALGELKGNALGAGGKNAPNAFVDLKVVVVKENGDGGVEGRVVEEGIGDLVLQKPLRRWLWLSLLHLHRPINLLPCLKFTGDVTYGACYVNDFSAAALSTDLLIHYGHSCLVPIDSTTISCLYVFVDIKIDVSHLVDTVKLNLESCAQNLVLAGIIQFAYAIRAAKPELEKSMLRVLVPQSKNFSAGEVPRCTAPKVSLMDSFSENPENSVLVFVADGRFHLEAIMIANLGIKAFRQGKPKILERLVKNMKEKWFLYTIFLMSDISPVRIALFEDSVDAWIQIACPHECSCGEDENGNEKSDFGSEYPMDYSQDGGEWNSSYVNKSSHPGVYVHGGEGSEDVGEREGVHEEALGELKGNVLGVDGENAPNAFVDLKVVVVKENGDCGVEGRVVEEGIGDLVLQKPLRHWLWLSLLHLHRPINLLPSQILCKPFFFLSVSKTHSTTFYFPYLRRSGGRWKGKTAGDVTYGACYVDDFFAALSTDLIIHYGHNCFVPIDSTTTPCLYVFVDIKINVFHLVDTVKLNLESCVQNLVLACIIQFAYAIRAAKPELEKSMLRVLVPQSKPLSAGKVLRCTAPKVSLMDLFSENTILVFVADGRFHLEAIMIANLGIKAFRYDPYIGMLFLKEYYHVGMKESRKALHGLHCLRTPWMLGFRLLVLSYRLIGVMLLENHCSIPFEAEIALGVIPGWWKKKKNVLVAKVQEGCEDGGVSCQKSDDSSSECSCGEDENGNEKSDFGCEYPMDYSQDGGEWNSSYVNKSSRLGVYGHCGEGSEDVGEREEVHEEALGELKGNALGAGIKNAPNAFVDLEVVVVRENGDGSVEGRVIEDGIGNSVLHKLLRRWLWLSLLHLHRPINLLPSLIFCKPIFFLSLSETHSATFYLPHLKGTHVQPAQRCEKQNTSTEGGLENEFGVGWGEAEGGGRERQPLTSPTTLVMSATSPPLHSLPISSSITATAALSLSIPPPSPVSTSLSTTKSTVAKLKLEKSGFRVLVPQSKPLSAGEVLACVAPKVLLIDSFSENLENSILVFVPDGRFHLEAIMIANLGIKAFRYDPYIEKKFLEEYDHVGIKESRKGAILRAGEEARNWGVVLGTLGRQGKPKILEILEKNMKEKGFLYTVFLMSEISPARIALFEDTVDAWIQISCPRLSIDWGDVFGKPVLNPFKVEIALGVIPGWWEKKNCVGGKAARSLSRLQCKLPEER